MNGRAAPVNASDRATTRVLLVRHAEPLPYTGDGNDDARPLSPRGRADALALSGRLADEPIEAVYSSPSARAMETVEPSARLRGMDVQLLPDLRERLLCRHFLPDWQEHLRRAWCDFDYCVAGGETSRIAQRRGLAALGAIAARHPSRTAMLGSHGNLIALVLHALDPSVDFAFWEAIPVPAVYRLERTPGAAWRTVGMDISTAG